MAVRVGATNGRREIAGHLSGCRSRILSGYQEALQDSGNALARDPTSLRQCLDQADSILADTVDQLGGRSPDPQDVALSRQIGAARAAANVHPSESLRAASLLFSIANRHLAEFRGTSPDAATAFVDAISMLHENLMRRIREGLFSYAGYLLAKVDEVSLAERHRLSREIHDRLGHQLAVVHQNLELFDLYLATDRAEADRRATTARELLQETMQDLPGLISDLRLAVPLEDITSALVEYAGAVSDANVRVVGTGDEGWASPVVRGQCFLVVREALRNALTHGKPENVWVSVDVEPCRFRATVSDDGTGFDVRRAAEHAMGSGLGSMRERATLVGGSLVVQSRVGGGTRVELLVPLLGVRDAEGT